MKTLEIKLSGSGTVDSLAVSLIELGRQLQIANVYGSDIPKSFEDSTICVEIIEE